MNTTTQGNLTELREFVRQQAADDATMPADDRRHQFKIVADVVGQETSLKPDVRKGLLKDYSGQIALARAD